jgi:hypothetical protein
MSLPQPRHLREVFQTLSQRSLIAVNSFAERLALDELMGNEVGAVRPPRFRRRVRCSGG